MKESEDLIEEVNITRKLLLRIQVKRIIQP